MPPTLKTYQNAITRWGLETFGEVSAVRIGTRMNVEVAELLEALQVLQDTPPEDGRRADRKRAAAFEVADVFIMLVQVGSALGIELDEYVVEKFQINRKRVWAEQNGSVRHLEEK